MILVRKVMIGALAFHVSAVPLAAESEQCRVNEAVEPRIFEVPRHHMAHSEHVIFAQATNARLFNLDPLDQVVPELAETWEEDVQAETLTITLSQACRWSDGAPITAKDVAQGLRSLYRFDAPTVAGWQAIEGANEVVNDGAPLDRLAIEALDERTLRIGTTTDPELALYALTSPAFSPIPTHVQGHEVLPANSPRRVFSGPFYIADVTESIVTLERNPYFCDPDLVRADSRSFYLTDAQADRFALFRAGKLDTFADIPSDQATLIMSQMDEADKPSLMLERSHRQVNLMLFPNHPALQDLETRKLFRDAIDFDAILKIGAVGDVDIRSQAQSLFHDLTGFDNVPYPVLSESRDEAIAALRAHMEAAGYSAANPARITITTYPLQRFERTAAVIASMMRQVHFEVDVLKQDSFNAFSNAIANRQADVYLVSWTLDFPHPLNSWEGVFFFHQVLRLSDGSWRDFSPANAYLDEVTRLKAKIDRAVGNDEILATLSEAEKSLSDWHFMLPLYEEGVPVLVSADHVLPNAHYYWRRFGGC